MSVPFVSGQVALLQSLKPDLTLAQTSLLLAGTAYDVNAQNPNYRDLLGAGEVNIGASVSALSTNSWPTGADNLFQGCLP
jgi:hypothetical protein